MIDFETAARKAAKAAFDVIRHIIAEHPDLFEKTNETHWAARDVLEIEITKHYADLAETFGLLVEVGKFISEYRAICLSWKGRRLELIDMDNLDDLDKEWESMNKTTKAIGNKIIAILDNPRIAALLKKDAFDKGAENG